MRPTHCTTVAMCTTVPRMVVGSVVQFQAAIRPLHLAAMRSLSLLLLSSALWTTLFTSTVAFIPSHLSPASISPAHAITVTRIGLRGAGLQVASSRTLPLRMASGPAAEESKKTSALGDLLGECKDWGLVRWVAVNPAGSVLETTADMSVGQNSFEVPGKGQYLTLATPDKLFECHINVDKAKTVTFSQDPAKIGGHTLHVMRVKDDAGAIMMSLMLQYDPAKGPGNYFDGAEAAFKKVMDKYGPEHTL